MALVETYTYRALLARDGGRPIVVKRRTSRMQTPPNRDWTGFFIGQVRVTGESGLFLSAVQQN
jgi:hypothetical protein